jgi:hypothetical protein
MYYVLVVGAVGGGVVIWRRGTTIVPFVGLLAEVLLATVITFGATRYRAPLEVGLVVLSAVAVDALWQRLATKPPPEIVTAEPESAVLV